MSVKNKIAQLEQRIENFKNNKKLAEETGEMRRAKKYAGYIEETRNKIKELEKDIPLESNERLREIIDTLNADNEKLREQIEELHDQVQEQNQRIDNFINPPEPEPEKEEEVEMVECPWCHRKFKGVQGLKAHQRWCKQGGQQ